MLFLQWFGGQLAEPARATILVLDEAGSRLMHELRIHRFLSLWLVTRDMSTRTDMTRTRGQITFHPVCVPAEVLERKNARCKRGFDAFFTGDLQILRHGCLFAQILHPSSLELRWFCCARKTRLATSIVVWTKIPKKRFRRWLKSAFSILFNEDRRRRGRKWTKTMIAMVFRLGSWKNIRPKYKLWRRDMHIQIKKYMHTHSWHEFWFCVFSCWLLFYLTFPVQFVWGIPARAFCIGNWAKLRKSEHNDARLHEFMHVEKRRRCAPGGYVKQRITKQHSEKQRCWLLHSTSVYHQCTVFVPFLRFLHLFGCF